MNKIQLREWIDTLGGEELYQRILKSWDGATLDVGIQRRKIRRQLEEFQKSQTQWITHLWKESFEKASSQCEDYGKRLGVALEELEALKRKILAASTKQHFLTSEEKRWGVRAAKLLEKDIQALRDAADRDFPPL